MNKGLSEQCFSAERLVDAVRLECCDALSDSQVNILLLCGHRLRQGVEGWQVVRGGDPVDRLKDLRMLRGWVCVVGCRCFLTREGADFLRRAMGRVLTTKNYENC